MNRGIKQRWDILRNPIIPKSQMQMLHIFFWKSRLSWQPGEAKHVPCKGDCVKAIGQAYAERPGERKLSKLLK